MRIHVNRRLAGTAMIIVGLVLLGFGTAAAPIAGDGHFRAVAATTAITNDTHPATLTGRAYGLSSSGLVEISPTPDTGSISTTKSGTFGPPCVVSISGLISSDTLCAKVTTSTTPAKSTSTASVNDTTVGVLGLPAIHVGLVESTSTSTCSSTGGDSTIASISVGGVPVNVDLDPAPDTMISVLGITLEFNEQIPMAHSVGTTVNAVHIKALGLLDVVIASSESDAEDCVIPTPVATTTSSQSTGSSSSSQASSTTTTGTAATSTTTSTTTGSSRASSTAASSSSNGAGTGVAGTSTGTPGTGAEVAFGVGLGLVIGGAALAFTAGPRRRRPAR